MTKFLHIVCLDAPSPPDYGGAIDMYYKIKALAEVGVKITLHYFDYKTGRNADGLTYDCEKAFAYSRKSLLQAPPFSKPHIVASRINQKLIERLNTDNNPVLLEGLHCTGIIPYLKRAGRKIVVRLHNDESAYYHTLANSETNFFKTAYYTIESQLLKHYQKHLPAGVTYTAITSTDTDVLKTRYALINAFFVPAFIPWQHVTSLIGKGSYCLYHGNLSVAENEAAALWLIETVFSQIDVPLVIAGKNISGKLKNAATPFHHIEWITNPDDAELTRLIQQAHLHVLPDFNQTGIKLKLLHALFCGRFCITNSSEIDNNDTVAQARTPQEYIDYIKRFMNREFSTADIVQRKKSLQLYNNQQNAELLTTHLY